MWTIYYPKEITMRDDLSRIAGPKVDKIVDVKGRVFERKYTSETTVESRRFDPSNHAGHPGNNESKVWVRINVQQNFTFTDYKSGHLYGVEYKNVELTVSCLSSNSSNHTCGSRTCDASIECCFLPGPTGPRGPTGYTGPTGATGPTGPTGPEAATAFGFFFNNGSQTVLSNEQVPLPFIGPAPVGMAITANVVTIGVNGTYEISYNVTAVDIVGDNQWIVGIRFNGITAVTGSYVGINLGAVGNLVATNGSTILVNLLAGNTIELVNYGLQSFTLSSSLGVDGVISATASLVLKRIAA